MPLDRWYPLPCDESGLVDRDVFGRYVQALLGETDPEQRARVLTRTILEQWDLTRDVWWWLQVRVIEMRLRQCTLDLDRYRDWRARWIAEQIEIRTRRERHPGILDPGYRHRLRGQIVEWRERAKEAYLLADGVTAARCHARADELCQRLQDDAVARWQSGRGGVHPGRRRCARQAYHEAVALGWVPPEGVPVLEPLPELRTRRERPRKDADFKPIRLSRQERTARHMAAALETCHRGAAKMAASLAARGITP